MSASRNLAGWLDYQASLHSRDIELGLDRVGAVADRLELRTPAYRVVAVAGTNGKGSTAVLIAGLIGERARTGVYTSPHLWRYNERVVIDGVAVADADLVAAFEAIEAARGTTALTYFEFGTLAALWIFARASVEVAILEVGLGGRLDAVNIVDADIAVITSIGLDHTAWLGATREAIGAEKAGIMRRDRPVFCGDRRAPASIADSAARRGARLCVIGRDFDIVADRRGWHWSCGPQRLEMAPHADVYPDNLATAAATVAALGFGLGAADVVRAGARRAQLPGRREVIDGPIPIIYDVGHNDDAAALLVDALRRRPPAGRTHLILGMLADKPVESVGKRLTKIADRLYPAGLDQATPRGLSAKTLAERLGYVGPCFDDPRTAMAAARAAAIEGDRIVVCGSFFTVALARRGEHE